MDAHNSIDSGSIQKIVEQLPTNAAVMMAWGDRDEEQLRFVGDRAKQREADGISAVGVARKD